MVSSSRANATKGIFLGFAAFALFSVSDACVKLIKGGLAPMESAFLGAIFAFMLMPFLVGRRGRWADIVRTSNRPLWLLRFFCYPVCVIGSVTAFTHLSMAEAFVLIFLQPAFVTVISVAVLKDKVGWRRWAAVVVGFVGVLIVLRPGFRDLSIGHVGALACGLFGSVSVLIYRVAGPTEKPISLFGAGMLGGVIGCGVVALPVFQWPTPWQWLLLAGYGLLAAAANLVLMRATLHASAPQVSPTQYSQMLWAILLDYLLFEFSLDLATLIGIVFILGSGLLTLTPDRRSDPGHRPA